MAPSLDDRQPLPGRVPSKSLRMVTVPLHQTEAPHMDHDKGRNRGRHAESNSRADILTQMREASASSVFVKRESAQRPT